MDELVAGRAYFRVYRTSGKADVARAVTDAVRASGASVVTATSGKRAPVYVTADTAHGERFGLLIYPFRATTVLTRNRPPDEARTQVRYGAQKTWTEDHSLGLDPAGVDVTMVLGCHLEMGVFVGLDPSTYDPLPMGISVETKVGDLERAKQSGWVVMNRDNFAGVRRSSARAPKGLETLVLFAPHRLLDYARLERRASDLRLDPSLRFAAAEALASPAGDEASTLHVLEQQFDLSGTDILDIIAGRSRLAVAVRGGVAEHHLERVLHEHPDVLEVTRLDADGLHDFDVRLRDGKRIRVECKNASPTRYADGSERVEVQKTRASKGDPASRFYEVTQFDIVAACLFATRGEWTFRFKSTSELVRHASYPDRLAPLQRVDATWSTSPALT